MKTSLEKKRLIYDYLDILCKGYETGDFFDLYPCLSRDCVMESQWVLTPNVGYDAVVDYFTGKGATLRRANAFPSCSIQELVGSINPISNAKACINETKGIKGKVGLNYTPGELCMLMEQENGDEKIEVIVRVQLDDNEKIKRIDLCMPELFQYRDYYIFVDFVPANGESDIEEGTIRICESYFNQLFLFLGMASFDFDVYDDLCIPIHTWLECLDYWKDFFSCKSFDDAFEKMCGINYSDFSVANDFAIRNLSSNGKQMWQYRENNEIILNELIEWTNKYKDICTNINAYGF